MEDESRILKRKRHHHTFSEEKESVVESKSNIVPKHSDHKPKKGNKSKLSEFQRISSNFKELSLRLNSYSKHSMSVKEVSKLRNEIKYILKAEFSYNLIDKSKIGKSLALFLKKSKHLKMTYGIKALISEAERAKNRVTIFIRNIFFDENHYYDSDISSYKSESPVHKSNRKRKSSHGFNMLLKASQKLDERANHKRIRHSNSFFQLQNRSIPLRKFSTTENVFIPQPKFLKDSPMMDTPQRIEPFDTHEQGSNLVNLQASGNDQSNPSLIDFLLQEQKKTRSNSSDLPNLNFTGNQNSIEPSSGLESLLTDYLLSMPSCLDEFYKVMGELFVNELLKQRNDLDNPFQLMKELLVGKLQRNEEYCNSNIISSMLAQAVADSKAENSVPQQIESDFLQNMLNGNLQQESAINSEGMDFGKPALTSIPIVNNISKEEESIQQDQKWSTKI